MNAGSLSFNLRSSVDVTSSVGVLDHLDVFGAWPFRALTFGERDALSFAKLFKADTLQVRHVKKHVLPSTGVNKSKTFVRQPFDRTFCHQSASKKKLE